MSDTILEQAMDAARRGSKLVAVVAVTCAEAAGIAARLNKMAFDNGLLSRRTRRYEVLVNSCVITFHGAQFAARELCGRRCLILVDDFVWEDGLKRSKAWHDELEALSELINEIGGVHR